MKKRFGADGRNGDEKSPRASTPGDSKTDRSSSAPDSVDGDLSIDELMRRYLPSSSGEQHADDAKGGSRQTEKSARPAARKTEPSPEPEAQPPKKSGGLFARMRAAAKPEDNSPAVPDEKVFDELTRDEETRPMTPEEKEISDSLMAVLSGTQERQKAAAERRVRERREADRSDLSAAFEDAVRKGSTASNERVAAERKSAERFAPAETDVPAEKPSPAKPAEEAEEPKKPAASAVTEERYNSGTDATIRFDPAVVDEMNAAFADESDAPKKGAAKAGPNAGSDGSPDADTREVETSFFRFRRTKDKKSETVREEISGKDEPQENAPAEETREVPVPEDLRETPAAENCSLRYCGRSDGGTDKGVPACG